MGATWILLHLVSCQAQMKEETIEELRSKAMKKGYSMARANPKQTEIEDIILGEIGDIVVMHGSPTIHSVHCSGRNHLYLPTNTTAFEQSPCIKCCLSHPSKVQFCQCRFQTEQMELLTRPAGSAQLCSLCILLKALFGR